LTVVPEGRVQGSDIIAALEGSGGRDRYRCGNCGNVLASGLGPNFVLTEVVRFGWYVNAAVINNVTLAISGADLTPSGQSDFEEEKAQPNAPAPLRGKFSALVRIKRRIIGFAAKLLATAIVLGLLALLKEYVLPEWKGPEDFQTKLEIAAGDLNPTALLDSVFAWGDYLFVPIREGFDRFFGFIGTLIDWIVGSIQHLLSPSVIPLVRFLITVVLSPVILVTALVMGLIAFVYFCVAVIVSPITLTLTIMMKGNIFEAVLALVVFLPLTGLVVRFITSEAASDLPLKERAGLLWLGTMMALCVTTLFYLFVQAAMLSAAWTVGRLIALAPGVAGGAVILAFIGECMGDTIKEVVTTPLVNALKKVILTIFRIR
jgi:hypothetical protein